MEAGALVPDLEGDLGKCGDGGGGSGMSRGAWEVVEAGALAPDLVEKLGISMAVVKAAGCRRSPGGGGSGGTCAGSEGEA
jgi:hypothetical protein